MHYCAPAPNTVQDQRGQPNKSAPSLKKRPLLFRFPQRFCLRLFNRQYISLIFDCLLALQLSPSHPRRFRLAGSEPPLVHACPLPPHSFSLFSLFSASLPSFPPLSYWSWRQSLVIGQGRFCFVPTSSFFDCPLRLPGSHPGGSPFSHCVPVLCVAIPLDALLSTTWQ